MKAKDTKIIIEPVPLERALEEAYKAGMKEVVEWIEGESWTEWNGVISIEKPRNVLFDEGEWQAKLKEWGVK